MWDANCISVLTERKFIKQKEECKGMEGMMVISALSRVFTVAVGRQMGNVFISTFSLDKMLLLTVTNKEKENKDTSAVPLSNTPFFNASMTLDATHN